MFFIILSFFSTYFGRITAPSCRTAMPLHLKDGPAAWKHDEAEVLRFASLQWSLYASLFANCAREGPTNGAK